MAEIDYQTALLLQHQFEREYQISTSDYKLALQLQEQFRKEAGDVTSGNSSDYHLARELQEQFKKEHEIERPRNALVYEKSCQNDPSKCLVDPSWEVIDPTPDVHVLFMAFNERFFWGTLASVVVSWSTRMTMCAGVCSYQGRGGMCSITLSEPLLKLRPRKDLVETLLHEMIHAYLFITHNNRDRDGHGPEFHRHMYRINQEAGTNISVYHDFHDEVRLYQQHWWRCDGPCTQWKPYFGMVRRATNRAPGSYDRWWEDHRRKCGGTFIKVKEPEKNKNSKTINKVKTKEKDPINLMGDIRKYISQTNTNSQTSNGKSSNQKAKKENKPNTSSSKSVSKTPKKSQIVHGDYRGVNISNVVSSVSPNIFGFTNLKSAGKSGTILVHKKSSSTSKLQDCTNNRKTSTENENTLVSKKPVDNEDYAAVRNHWLRKFDNATSEVSGKKRTNPSPIQTEPTKILKILKEVECPVCGLQISADDLNFHLDTCLKQNDDIFVVENDVVDVTEDKKCPVCKAALNSKEYDNHVEGCLMTMIDSIEKEYELPSKITTCLACDKEILKSELDVHLEDCSSMTSVFDTSNMIIEESPSKDGDKDDCCNCPFCLKLIPESQMRSHLDCCLNEIDDSPEIQENKSVIDLLFKDSF
ncbi:DNA-dependent metalloprotease dvc-1 [Cylas formicarius]|uniref:DNA-dependent metalloprotease dvc-1 n=1 Tax=Cylas formicarius TaxID=197179 RepID=UPI002958BB8C|nr:DNA-dependent metalloprotease dvc-1 [Cylas formicarius]